MIDVLTTKRHSRKEVINVVSTFSLVWYNVATLNQRWNNIVYVKVEIQNIEQRQISVVYFNVVMNNVRQRGNNIVIFIIIFSIE